MFLSIDDDTRLATLKSKAEQALESKAKYNKKAQKLLQQLKQAKTNLGNCNQTQNNNRFFSEPSQPEITLSNCNYRVAKFLYKTLV